jgi:chorismate mutase/prephenate dehydrogenase
VRGSLPSPDGERLAALREEIAALDDALIDILARRAALAAEIGEIKQRLGLPVMDPAREAEVVRRAAAAARNRGVDPELVRAVLWRVIDHARGVQDS